MDARVRPGGQVLLALLPPPAPLDLVELEQDLAVARRLPGRIQESDVDAVLLVGEQHSARLVALRNAHADVALERRVRNAEAVDAEGATRLEDARREVGAQLAGGDGLGFDPRVDLRLARLVERALEDLLALRVVAPGRVVEGVLLEALKARGRSAQRELDVGLQASRGRAVEPGRAERARDAALAAQLLRPEVHRDLEPVGHHGLDLERLVEARPAHAHAGVVVAGRGVRRRGDVERVEAVDRLGARQAAHELAARVHEVEAHRVVGGQALRRVEQHEGQVHRVARAPDAALAVEEALEALRRPRAGHVEVRHRQRSSAVHPQVAGLAAVANARQERRPRDGEVRDRRRGRCARSRAAAAGSRRASRRRPRRARSS